MFLDTEIVFLGTGIVVLGFRIIDLGPESIAVGTDISESANGREENEGFGSTGISGFRQRHRQ